MSRVPILKKWRLTAIAKRWRSGDWKVARTRREENLSYIIIVNALTSQPATGRPWLSGRNLNLNHGMLLS